MYQQPSSSPTAGMRSQLATARRNDHLQNIIMAFCFETSIQIALRSAQHKTQLSLPLQLLLLSVLLTFSALFVARFIALKFPAAAQVLEKIVVFFAVTAFFLAAATPAPRDIKCVISAVYAITLLAIFICKST